jgi:hypothetical protein
MSKVVVKKSKAPQAPDAVVKLKIPEGMNLMETRLIQRLKKPFKPVDASGTPLEKLLADNPFSFGGGLKNGGLSDKAMELIRDIWEFDYMGAAEFEFGAVPQALEKMVKAYLTPHLNGEMIFTEMLFDFGYIKSIFESDDIDPGKIVQKPVYIVAPKDLMTYAVEVVKVQASSDWPDHKIMYLKEHSGLNRAVRDCKRPVWHQVCGWLELDHGFFFSIDKEMAYKFAELMGVSHG